MSFGEYFSMSCNSLLKLLQHFVFLVFQGQGGSLDARLGTVVSGRRRLTGRRFLRDRLSLLKYPQVMKERRVVGSDAFVNKFLDATAEEVAVLRKAGSLPILMDGLPVNAEFHGSSP